MKIFAVSFLVSISSVFALTYETGTPYRYSYSTDVLLNEPTNEGQLSIKSSTGFKLDSNVQVTLVWKNEQNILGKLEILECKLTSAVPRNDADNVFSGAPCNQVTKDPIYVHFKDSKIVQLFASTEDPTPSVNIKRGIASLFQVNKNGGREVDASGDCLVHYINTGNNVIKSKDYTSCIKPDSGEFTSPRVILGLIRDSAITTTYVLSDDKSIIKSATSVESHVSRVTMRKALSSAVLSRQSLSYLNSEGEQFTVDGNSLDEAIANLGNNYLSVSPITDFVQQHCTKECRPAAEIVAENREHLKSDYLAKVELSSAYLTVLEKFRNCGKEEILSILMDDNNQEIVPQLIDIVAVTQTNAAHEAMVEILDFNNADMLDLIDRYLVSVSYLSHPSHDILENLLKISKNDVENEKIRESVALSLGALVHTLCLLGKCDSQIVQDTSDWFKEALDKYEEDTDKVIFLRAMSNSKLSDHVPLIANYAVHGKSSKVHVAALESLKMFDGSVLTAPEVRQSLNEIYHQNHRKYESAARSNAAGLILNNNPSQQEITNLVLSLTDQDNLELTAFMQRKIKDVLKNNVKLRRSLEDDIMKDPKNFQL
uniref:Microsomal triglyceride transfer protein large subunit-like n=1 Tax=Saccoglossus kowalevskii TaxID=10224 RepID=A0ABM0GWY2_SACKO|nr:PREDICTED: microsomal triglyceride transfer protein large subunit-like [Saccoglossus kowalevskii]